MRTAQAGGPFGGAPEGSSDSPVKLMSMVAVVFTAVIVRFGLLQ